MGQVQKLGTIHSFFRSRSHSEDLLGSPLESKVVGTLIPQIAYDGIFRYSVEGYDFARLTTHD